MSILIGLAHEPVFNAAVATQIVFQQPAKRLIAGHWPGVSDNTRQLLHATFLVIKLQTVK
ncbi:hypothetical protein FVE88_09310 [Ectopseudomonas mendocina]|nr:hypothetical protein FVE88_09310 [Pseudomonas mendocina]